MNLFSFKDRELLRRRRRLANLDRCFDYEPTIMIPHEQVFCVVVEYTDSDYVINKRIMSERV